VNSDDSDSLSETHSRYSEPTSPTKVKDEFEFVEERAEIYSQDSLRKTMRDANKSKSPTRDIDKGLGPSLNIRGGSNKNVLKGASSRNVLKEKIVKKNKKKLKLKINNIIASIDKSIYEINKNNDNKVVLKQFKKRHTSRKKSIDQDKSVRDRSNKVDKRAASKLPFNIQTTSQHVGDRGS
jgi:hypothetical protein